MKVSLFILASFFSANSIAGVFKCTDSTGNTSYQAKPCEKQKQAFEMNIKTGSKIDLTQQQNRQKLNEEQKQQQKQQQERQRQLLAQKIEQRKKATLAESAITQALIKNSPKQYSAFAIPPYTPDKLPPLVKQFEPRLPEIEKFRRLAALKALNSGHCQRVEADELNIKSQKQQLVFLVDCSSGKSFYFNESELTKE